MRVERCWGLSDRARVILDGEMLVFDPVDKRYMAFGNLKTAALDKSDDKNKPRACFKVFDVLWYKVYGQPAGKSLLNHSQRVRKEALSKIFTDKEGYIQHASRQECTKGEEITKALNFIMERLCVRIDRRVGLTSTAARAS